MESTIYTVAGKDFELQHHGVKGMKWGKRKARPEPVGTGRSGRQAGADSPEAQAAAKEARRQKAKRAAKIGAVVAGTALAAYGAKKLHDAIRDKNFEIRMKQGSDFIKSQMGNPAYRTHPGMSTAELLTADKRYTQFVSDAYSAHRRMADTDSFRAAVKNVAGHYVDKLRR